MFFFFSPSHLQKQPPPKKIHQMHFLVPMVPAAWHRFTLPISRNCLIPKWNLLGNWHLQLKICCPFFHSQTVLAYCPFIPFHKGRLSSWMMAISSGSVSGYLPNVLCTGIWPLSLPYSTQISERNVPGYVYLLWRLCTLSGLFHYPLRVVEREQPHLNLM